MKNLQNQYHEIVPFTRGHKVASRGQGGMEWGPDLCVTVGEWVTDTGFGVSWRAG